MTVVVGLSNGKLWRKNMVNVIGMYYVYETAILLLLFQQ